MPTYKVLEKSFINNTLLEPGETVEYDGKPGSNLELIKETRGRRKAEEPDSPEE